MLMNLRKAEYKGHESGQILFLFPNADSLSREPIIQFSHQPGSRNEIHILEKFPHIICWYKLDRNPKLPKNTQWRNNPNKKQEEIKNQQTMRAWDNLLVLSLRSSNRKDLESHQIQVQKQLKLLCFPSISQQENFIWKKTKMQ